MFKNKVDTYRKRGLVVFPLFFTVLVSFLFSYIYLGIDTKYFSRELWVPMKQKIVSFGELLLENAETENVPSNRSNSSSIHQREDRYFINGTEVTKAEWDAYQQSKNQKSLQDYIYTSPTPYPTFPPWSPPEYPTSDEADTFNKEFQQKYNEMKVKNDASFAEFCKKYPDANICD